MSKFKNMSYAEAVSRAKDYLEDIRTTRFRICELALTVCDIRMGGHYNPKMYSIKKFAGDIGMPYKTLRNWLEIYRNTVKKLDIPIKEIDKVDNRVLRNMTKEINNTSTKKEVQLAYQKYSKWTKEDYALERNVRAMIGVRNMLQDYVLEKLDEDQLNKLFRLLDEVNDARHKYLRSKKGRVA